MILMCRSALIRGHQQQATDWAFYIYQHLICLGPYLMPRGIARPMHELLQLRLLNQVMHMGAYYYYPSDAYLEAASLLQEYLRYARPAARQVIAGRAENERIVRVLTGLQNGFAMHAALTPYLRLDGAENASPTQAADAQRGAAMFRWAWSSLRMKGLHKDLPTLDELRDFMHGQ